MKGARTIYRFQTSYVMLLRCGDSSTCTKNASPVIQGWQKVLFIIMMVAPDGLTPVLIPLFHGFNWIVLFTELCIDRFVPSTLLRVVLVGSFLQ